MDANLWVSITSSTCLNESSSYTYTHSPLGFKKNKIFMKKLHFFSQEGCLAPNKMELRKRSEAEQELWLETARRYLERPEFLSWAEHVMYIGEKE